MGDVFVGYGGLALSFVILVTIMLWMFIRANNISWIRKTIAIVIALGYGIILYYIPGQFTGFASEDVRGVNQVIILDFHVVEEDGIYFTVLDFNKENVLGLLPRPSDAMKTTAPRLYKIAYNSEIHKELEEAWEKVKKSKGRKRMKGNLRAIRNLFPGQKPFELYDPAEVLRKEPEE